VSRHWTVGGIPGGGSRHPRRAEPPDVAGDGRALRNVLEKIGTAIQDRVRYRTGLDWTGYARVLVHQVTGAYLDRFVEVTGVPVDKLDVTVGTHGNMASATLGVQLARVWSSLAAGDRVLFVGLGGGVSVMTMAWQR
jgi:3-oxoacyl-[acyl-carrier-protein] synthase-3